jgi:Na+/melibiose symporter-like transporter
VIADRTNTRWGKFRPWVLWTAVPFGIMGFLTFMTPDLGAGGKLVYAYLTYIVLMMVYSANNLPYSALSGVMTGDLGERTSLSSYRFVCAMVAQLVIQGLALPMVHHFGGGNNAKGYQVTMGIFSALAVVLFLITFATTRERIQPPPGQKAPVRQHFADLLKNGPWLAMFVLTLVLFITLAMRGSVVPYYFNYYVDKPSLAGLLGAFGVADGGASDPGRIVSVGFSVFNVLGTLATILAIFFSKALAVRFGKRNVFVAGLMATVLFTAAFFFLPPEAVTAMFVCEILRQFAYGFTIPLLWAMMADVADFSEWKTGRRATAIVFSAIVFALKAGLGFGGAITGFVLSLYGYVPNVAQAAPALDGIRLTMSVFPGVSFAICAVCLLFYSIDKRCEIQMTNELAERRKQYAAQGA